MKIAQGAQERPNKGTQYDLSADMRTVTVTKPDGGQTVQGEPREDRPYPPVSKSK
jgi:hypothetical protein